MIKLSCEVLLMMVTIDETFVGGDGGDVFVNVIPGFFQCAIFPAFIFGDGIVRAGAVCILTSHITRYLCAVREGGLNPFILNVRECEGACAYHICQFLFFGLEE